MEAILKTVCILVPVLATRLESAEEYSGTISQLHHEAWSMWIGACENFPPFVCGECEQNFRKIRKECRLFESATGKSKSISADSYGTPW